MKVSIIGLGLIGGSFGLALKKRIENVHIYGWDANPDHQSEALALGIIDERAKSLEEVVAQGEWIILAIPVNAVESLISQCMPSLRIEQVLVDFGSSKQLICNAADAQKNRGQFIAAHPIAGTEYSGPSAAKADLFEDKVMIVCDQEKSMKVNVDGFRRICKIIGMETRYLSAEDHDVQLAYVSHLSHVIAFGLSNTVLEKEASDSEILDLAGSGFASTVRLAKSSPEMWTPIFRKNSKAILESLDRYLGHLNDFRNILEAGDDEAIHRFLTKGREIRKILK